MNVANNLTPRDFREYIPLIPASLFLLVLPINHTIALRMICLFLMAAGALHLHFRTPAPSLPIKRPLALWAGFAILSLAWSLDPVFTLNELKTEIGYGMLAFFSFYVLTQGEREWRLWLNCLAVGMVVTVLLVQFVNRAAPGDFTGYNLAVVHGVVAYSTYLALISPFLLALWWSVHLHRIQRNLLWLCLLLLLLAGYVTLNRMFWLSFGAVLMVYALFWKVKNVRSQRIIILIAGGFLLLIAVLFVSVAKYRPADALQGTSADSGAMSHLVNTFAYSERYQIWGFWLERIAEKPFTGVGFGRDLPHYVYADIKPKEWFGMMFAHAHNLFLNYTLQLGVGGLVALLYLLGAMFLEFWRISRISLPQANIVGLCGMALVIALASKNMTDDLFWRSDSLLFWALAGMSLGYGRRLQFQR